MLEVRILHWLFLWRYDLDLEKFSKFQRVTQRDGVVGSPKIKISTKDLVFIGISTWTNFYKKSEDFLSRIKKVTAFFFNIPTQSWVVKAGRSSFKVASGDPKFWIFVRGLNFFLQSQKVWSVVLTFSPAALFLVTENCLKTLFLEVKS